MNTISKVLLLVLATSLTTVGCGKKDDGNKTQTPATETPTPVETETPPPVQPQPKTFPILTEEVTYEAGGTTLKGFLAYPKDVTGVPGVLVVHEWWGHNDYTRARAKQLAVLGYAALALDMYGDGKKAEHAKDAMAFMQEAMKDPAAAKARFDAAATLLRAHASTDPAKLSAIGYCYGGGVVLNMTRAGADLDLVASFHGSLGTKTPAKKGEVKADKVFVAHGAADEFVKPEVVEGFKKEMADAGVDLEFVAYEGAKHAFTNPAATENGKKFDLPLEYNEAADMASWAKLEALLQAAYK